MAKPKNKKLDTEELFQEKAKEKASDLQSIAGKENEPSESSLIPVPCESFPVNITLPCTVYMKKHDKIMVFRRQGEKINYKVALEMQKKGDSSLFIHQAFYKMFMESLDQMKLPKNTSKNDKIANAIRLRTLLLAYGQELVSG